MTEQFDPPRLTSIPQRVMETATSVFHLPHRHLKPRDLPPQRVHEYLDEAKSKQETLKDQLVAVGPHFDQGMGHLDMYYKTVEKFENEQLTDDVNMQWVKTLDRMKEDGLKDVIRAVNYTRPNGPPQEQAE